MLENVYGARFKCELHRKSFRNGIEWWWCNIDNDGDTCKDCVTSYGDTMEECFAKIDSIWSKKNHPIDDDMYFCVMEYTQIDDACKIEKDVSKMNKIDFVHVYNFLAQCVTKYALINDVDIEYSVDDECVRSFYDILSNFEIKIKRRGYYYKDAKRVHYVEWKQAINKLMKGE